MGWTALHFAVKESKVEMVKFLLGQGAQHTIDTTGEFFVTYGEDHRKVLRGTPLDIAKALDKKNIINLLEEHNVKVKASE